MGRDFGDVDGFDFDDASNGSGVDSPAPIPPHERVWRHPSEVGFAAVTSIDAEPINIGRNGRRLIGIASVAGVALGIALAVALQPDSLRSDPHDVIALTNSRLRVASFDHQQVPPVRIEPQAGSIAPPLDPKSNKVPSLAFGSRLVDSMRSATDAVSAVTRPTPETTSAPTMSTSTRSMGVLSESGEHLLTTMAAVSDIETIDVRLPNGKMVRGRILHTLPELHIAVLSVSDEPTTGTRADIKASGLSTDGSDYSPGQPVIVLIESPLELVIGEKIDSVLVALEAYASNISDFSSIAEGAPVVSKTGHLIGLCTHAGGRLGFIPVGLFETALAKMINVDDVATTTTPPQ